MNISERSYSHESSSVDHVEYEEGSFTTISPEFYVNIKYSCTPIISNWVIHPDTRQPSRVSSTHEPTDTKYIRLNHKQFLNDKYARKIIRDAIISWPVSHLTRGRMAKLALDKAREFVKSMPSSHQAAYLNLRVNPEINRVFDESLAILWATWRSLANAKDGMVPAVDSSIESLKNTTLMESGSCAICLEEFVNGGEGVTMPCSHIFHGDCIKKWLRTSHYCPICRFEMPTS